MQNKKFILGTVFGLIIGLGIGVTTPMLGSTKIQLPSKSKSSSVKEDKKTENSDAASSDKEGLSTSMKEMSKSLSNIQKELEKHTDQNEQIITTLKDIKSRVGIGN